MTERRQVTRREPIIIETSQGEFEAKPLPWTIRNDLGDLLIKSYLDAITSMVGAMSIGDDGKPVGGQFDDKAMDWDALLDLSFPSVDKKAFKELDIFEIRALLVASLDINGMSHMGYMIDPNLRSPAMEEMTEVPPQSDGPKITSIPDSGSPGTVETKSTP